MTKEERAYNIASAEGYVGLARQHIIEACVRIATEQKSIDIDRIPQLYVRWLMIDGEKPSWNEYANKALEE